MPRNRVQQQKGLSDDAFERLYPDEAAWRKAWFAWRWPEGFKCPRCAASEYCEIRDRQLLQCRRCRYQTSLIAGTVLQGTKLPMRVWFRAMHLLAQGKKGLSNIELGRRLGISTNAAWRIQHKLMQGSNGTAVTCLAPPGHGSRSTTPISAVSAPAKAPGAVGVARRPLSLPWRPPQMAVRCIPAFRSCAVSKLAKPNGYAPASWPERRSSATAANGFAALPSSRGSSINAMSPAPIAAPHATLPSAGQTRCSPISRTACSPPTEWSPPNICRATSAPSPGVSTDALSSKQSTSASPSRQRPPRQCPTASSNWLRLDGKRDRDYHRLAVLVIAGWIALPLGVDAFRTECH